VSKNYFALKGLIFSPDYDQIQSGWQLLSPVSASIPGKFLQSGLENLSCPGENLLPVGGKYLHPISTAIQGVESDGGFFGKRIRAGG